MKSVVFAMLAIQLMANLGPWGGEGYFPSAPRFDGFEHNHGVAFNTNAQPFNANAQPFNNQAWAPRPHHHKRRHSHKNNQQAAPKPDNCLDPAFRDAPYCQKPIFTRAGEKIPIYWKNRNIAVSPITNKVGGSI